MFAKKTCCKAEQVPSGKKSLELTAGETLKKARKRAPPNFFWAAACSACAVKLISKHLLHTRF